MRKSFGSLVDFALNKTPGNENVQVGLEGPDGTMPQHLDTAVAQEDAAATLALNLVLGGDTSYDIA